MTSDYGAASQLEKIDMLDFADFIVLNKFEKRGAEDALRDVRKQVMRNRKLFTTPPEELPVYPTIARQFNDAGVNALFIALCARLQEQGGRLRPWRPEGLAPIGMPRRQAIIPGERVRYLAEIAADGRDLHRAALTAAEAASRAHGLHRLRASPHSVYSTNRHAMRSSSNSTRPLWISARPAASTSFSRSRRGRRPNSPHSSAKIGVLPTPSWTGSRTNSRVTFARAAPAARRSSQSSQSARSKCSSRCSACSRPVLRTFHSIQNIRRSDSRT
jgi:hypothetical protein